AGAWIDAAAHRWASRVGHTARSALADSPVPAAVNRVCHQELQPFLAPNGADLGRHDSWLPYRHRAAHPRGHEAAARRSAERTPRYLRGLQRHQRLTCTAGRAYVAVRVAH